MKNFNLPNDYKPYIDKYFLRAKEVLQGENLNPRVKAQVFVRKGNCNLYGINEAIAILCKYSDIEKTGHIYALKEGSLFENCETVMTIEAPIQTIIDLETMYLGVISAETTMINGREKGNISFPLITQNMEKIVGLVTPRPVSYFGARHWRYDYDFQISAACFRGGAKDCSTDIGGSANATKGIGTIPHALEAIYHWKYGLKNAVTSSTIAFDRHMNNKIPRIALVDYANKEITDSMNVAHIVDAIRIDTCGENYMQDAIDVKGVGVQGVYFVRKELNDYGFSNVKIVLSSGFGNPEKVKMFLEAEEKYKIKLFDMLGVGGVFPARMSTMDIIEVEGMKIHKVGRLPRINERLEKVI